MVQIYVPTVRITRNPYSQYITRPGKIITPQTEKIPGEETKMKRNNAGGVSYKLDKWQQLDRFLILGSEGGTYYVGEKKLTKENASNVQACIKEDGLRVVNRVVEISTQGRAPKANPGLFTLALAISTGDPATKRAVVEALPKVARIGTHLFLFAEYANNMRGWGRVLRDAIGNWYVRHGVMNVDLESGRVEDSFTD